MSKFNFSKNVLRQKLIYDVKMFTDLIEKYYTKILW